MTKIELAAARFIYTWTGPDPATVEEWADRCSRGGRGADGQLGEAGRENRQRMVVRHRVLMELIQEILIPGVSDVVRNTLAGGNPNG